MKKYLLIIILVMSSISLAQDQISNSVVPVTYFINHIKQLSLLKNNLTKYKQASVVGVSGMGKTQLARMYAYENKNNYDLIWFIDCNLDINEELLKLAKTINSTFKSNLISEDITLIKKELMAYLSCKDKWLLVLDNLKVNETQKIQEFINWEHNGNIIFCSQDSGELPSIIKMIAFDKKDAITLANNILEKNDPKSAEFLAQEFVGYPILIVQGGQLLNQIPGLNQEEYKKRIQDSADKIKLNITLAIKELKPNAKRLLNKIALINNQAYSKELLKIIADDKNTIDDDIYQLSKFALISNTDPNENNPVFEMHDVIAQKIIEMNGIKINKSYLEDIVVKLIDATPKSGIKGRIFRSAKTMSENLEIILKNSEKYKVNIYNIMGLKLYLILQYINSWDNYNAKKLVDWFNKNDQEGQFKLWLMNNDEKHIYARYIKLIGAYYRNCSNNQLAIEYYIKAKEVFDKVKGYEAFKCNIFYALAISNIALGKIQEAKENIQIMEQMFTSGLVDKGDIGFLYFVKSQLFLIQGKYPEALDQINQDIAETVKQGLKLDDFFLTSRYMLKAEILNYLKKYQEAYVTVEQLYNMCKSSKKEEHEIFGRIFIQMARSELGLGKLDHALDHINKAIAIFLTDEHGNPKNTEYSQNLNLAQGYALQGDILFAQDNIKEAIESYKRSYAIYHYLYKDNSKNIVQVSDLYNHGAKAACKSKDLYNYKFFGKSQIKEFGIHHPNTVDMFEYCKQYNMDLWAKNHL